MSSHLYGRAYATRLDNLPAKSVLVKLCDEANEEGMGWPSAATIVRDTEIEPRTVARILKVFEVMGLIVRKNTFVNDRYGYRKVKAIYLDLAMLGTDLTEHFREVYAQMQGELAMKRLERRRVKMAAGVAGKMAKNGLKDQMELVSETEDLVFETSETVSETKPPDPHKGRPVIDPSLDPPAPPAREEGDDVGLTVEQQQHLDRLAAKDSPEVVEDFRCYYLEGNRKIREAQTAEAARAAELAAEEAQLKTAYPDVLAALDQVRKQCGFVWEPGRTPPLAVILAQILREGEAVGKPVWRTAPRMIAAWLERRATWRYGPKAFFANGEWGLTAKGENR